LDQEAQGLLEFDRFALDLTRGCLRDGDHDIDLPPKPFEVLRHLVVNAGRLVSKQELLDAVWPNVAVSDDSIVQCIRELRRKLRDEEHRLIKTVSRRGYLLDATVTPLEPPTSVGLTVKPPEGSQGIAVDFARPRMVRLFAVHKPRVWAGAMVSLLCVALAATYLVGRLWAPFVSSLWVQPSGIAPASLRLHPTFRDCNVCPEMVALPPGEFMMGSAKDEADRLRFEGPPRRVVITTPFAIGRFETSVDELTAFVEATATTMNSPLSPCFVTLSRNIDPPSIMVSENASFRRPGFDVTGAHPAGCVSWYDAQAYVAWLRRRTGKPYRLPTEVEWEYAARAGTATTFSFGNDERLLCDYARFADLASNYPWRDGCSSGMTTDGPIPVGKLKPNAWGIFDMLGNVAEWVEDCWTPNWTEIPTDGSAYARPSNCEMGVIRGGSWIAPSRRLRTAYRWRTQTFKRLQTNGFRVALTLDPP